ncbi:Alpha/Beta hydrolase protein [Syncephalis plumigaleata]|nr:Alpha/Beta hydrolase protein [Syncephalis plumigaleata]
MRYFRFLFLIHSAISSIVMANPLGNTVGESYESVIVNSYTDPVRLAYSVKGTGDKRALLIMGASSPMELWNLQVDFLVDKGYQVCVFDNRGAGRSDLPICISSIKGMADDTIGLLDHLGWTSNVHVVGSSMGGMIAMELAINYPQYVKSLCLTSTLADATIAQNQELMVERTRRRLAAVNQKTTSDFDKAFPKVWLDAPYKDNPGITNRDWVVQWSMTWIKQAGIIGQANAMKTHHVTDDRLALIHKANIPTIVCTGSDDTVIYMFNSEAIAKVLHAPLQVYKGCGHSVQIQEKDNYNQLLLDHFMNAILNEHNALFH